MYLQVQITDTIKIILAGIVGMLSLATAIVVFVFKYQRRVIHHQQEIKKINDRKQLELIQASVQGEEEERMRIANELHDDVGATLSSVRMFLHSAVKKDADPSVVRQSKELLDDSIRKVRNISHKLQPMLLQQLGLQASLASFATMMSQPGVVRMTYNSATELPRFDENIELSIYRIMQELTNNILKHAEATSIDVETMLGQGQLQTLVQHNGNGLTEEMYQEHIYKKGAIGLKNIVNRLKTIDATITFSQTTEALYLVTITVPLPNMPTDKNDSNGDH